MGNRINVLIFSNSVGFPKWNVWVISVVPSLQIVVFAIIKRYDDQRLRYINIGPILLVHVSKDSITHEQFDTQEWQATFLKAFNKRNRCIIAGMKKSMR